MMNGRFVYVPDLADIANEQGAELFGSVKDVNTVPEVAEAFGVCAQTVRRLIASGELESVHIGRAVRVTRSAMVDFIARQKVSTVQGKR